MNHAGEPTPASASSAGPSPAPSVDAFEEREAAMLLAADELRVRTLLTQLESGGVISHTGADEHLVPVEDRTFDGGAEQVRRAAVGGWLTLGAYLLILFALSVAPLSGVAPLRESATVFAAAWGSVRLGEAASRGDSVRRIGASAAIVAGALLLAIGGG